MQHKIPLRLKNGAQSIPLNHRVIPCTRLLDWCTCLNINSYRKRLATLCSSSVLTCVCVCHLSVYFPEPSFLCCSFVLNSHGEFKLTHKNIECACTQQTYKAQSARTYHFSSDQKGLTGTPCIIHVQQGLLYPFYKAYSTHLS